MAKIIGNLVLILLVLIFYCFVMVKPILRTMQDEKEEEKLV